MSFYMTQGLHRAVQRHPEKLATIFEERRRSYREFALRVARLAAALQTLGMGRGDRVGMLALNSDRYLEFYYGTWWGGGTVNPVNIRWSAAEIAYSLDDCDTRILLVDERFKGAAEELRQRSKSLRTLVYCGDGQTPDGMLNYEQLLAETSPMSDARSGGRDLAAVMYTGGTTGFPKGVMLSHDNLASNALSFICEGATHSDGVALLIAPMFHVACGVMINSHIMVGGTYAIAGMFTPQATLQAIQTHRVTHALLVPTMLQMLIDWPEARNYDISSVRLLAYGGSVISEALLKRALQFFPDAQFVQAYGMTEMSPCMTYLSARDHRSDKAGILRSAGRANLTTQVRIVDSQGAEAPRGVVGEVAASGPGVMLGYWNKPEQTAVVVRNGWMHTGDGGFMDEDGYLFIVDRVKDMIISGGENVYSAEVENALAQHPAVAISAVIGIPSDQWGEAVHAVVVLKPGSTHDIGDAASNEKLGAELIQHCRQFIAGYKCPRSVEFRASLPMTGAGKIQKTEVRKPYWEGKGRGVN
ncbi:MAG TPA: long-chain-fatty-acid--CoA ligase [Steroidobacteraceae bacterium]|nr:long-chain-fatty-acid--CoA ligase [Steroidobacteraceae bacterium]